MKDKEPLTQERLKSVINYCPDSGVLRWVKTTGNRAKVGDLAGAVEKTGYIRIRIDGNDYRAHRLAWLYMFGEWPSCLIDHINGDKRDNRISNLRSTNKVINGLNRHGEVKSVSSVRGVCWDKTNYKWVAQISYRGKHKKLGRYDNIEEAKLAYLGAKKFIMGSL